MTFEKKMLSNLYHGARNYKHFRSKRKQKRKMPRQKRKPKRKQATCRFETHCIFMFSIAFAYIIVACLPAAP